MRTFSPLQQVAINEFDKAVTSQDLYAFGWNRKYDACRFLVSCYDRLKELGIADAITPKEASEIRRATLVIN